MPYVNRTYRIVDGERIEGSWRHIFIKNGSTYFLSALKVYADGLIDCWGPRRFYNLSAKGGLRLGCDNASPRRLGQCPSSWRVAF